jgi:hypothetical protein
MRGAFLRRSALSKLEIIDACAPVEAGCRWIVLVRVIERAVVHRIDSQSRPGSVHTSGADCEGRIELSIGITLVGFVSNADLLTLASDADALQFFRPSFGV